MSAWWVGLITFACVLGGAFAGLALQAVLPGHHLRDDSKDVVKLVTGLMATLSALVLGLLVASAKSSFDAVNDGLKQTAAKIIVIDRLLAQYGPGAKEARDVLRGAYAARIDRLFPRGERTGSAASALSDDGAMQQFAATLRTLTPGDDDQRALKARAEQALQDLAQSRWAGFEAAATSTPTAFLVVLVSWLAAMFLSFGLFAPRNGTVLAALLVGALAVSTSIVLIEEMSLPFDGLIAVSGAPLRDALAVLGK
jgi:hypothetical protein